MTTTDDLATQMTGGGRAAVEQHAPASAVVLDRLERTTWEALDADLLELTARVVASVHGYPPLERPRDPRRAVVRRAVQHRRVDGERRGPCRAARSPGRLRLPVRPGRLRPRRR